MNQGDPYMMHYEPPLDRPENMFDSGTAPAKHTVSATFGPAQNSSSVSRESLPHHQNAESAGNLIYIQASTDDFNEHNQS